MKTFVTATFVCLLVAEISDASILYYEPKFEYVYDLNATIVVKGVETMRIYGKVGFVNIGDYGDKQEILMDIKIYKTTGQESNHHSAEKVDLSKWFSFVLSRRGEIMEVYHPLDESVGVVATKKGIANMLSSKLYHSHEVEYEKHAAGWRYSTMEHGIEGSHTAVYHVNEAEDAKRYVKTRTNFTHDMPNGRSRYLKTVEIKHNDTVVHRVAVEEEFILHMTHQDGFDPDKGFRPVKAVNDFSTIEIPAMETSARNELKFVERQPFNTERVRPTDLHETTILHKVSTAKPIHTSRSDILKSLEVIHENLACVRLEPQTGSQKLSRCFHNIVVELEQLPDDELDKLATFYFQEISNRWRTSTIDRNTMVDAFGGMRRPYVQEIFVNRIFKAAILDDQLVDRALTSVIDLPYKPSKVLLDTLIEFSFQDPEAYPLLKNDTKHTFLLALGGLVHKLQQYEEFDIASQITEMVHRRLGLHDPWSYRRKREVMTEEEALHYDLQKVILIETLGNAGINTSYDYIVSHVNTTNSQWIKRAGIHALRKYHHEDALDVLWTTAMYDEDQNIRYEAMLQYEKHPMAQSQGLNGNTSLQHRDKRGILDKELDFYLASPSLDWQKKIGSKSVGASFGLIVENVLDIHLSLLESSLDIRVHDEAYAIVHLGMFGFNYEFFIARLCFKGVAEYNLNILKEFDLSKDDNIFTKFANIVEDIIKSLKTAVDAFKLFLSGTPSFKNLVSDFVQSLKDIPKQILGLGTKISDAQTSLRVFNMESMPGFLYPVKTAIDAMATLFEKVRADVMGFYNSIVEAITIAIPEAAKQIFEAIQNIVKGFLDIYKDPKTSLFNIGSAVIKFWMNIQSLKETKDGIMGHTFVTQGVGPYWSDLSPQLVEIEEMMAEAQKSLDDSGNAWLNEEPDEDPFLLITKGKQSLHDIKLKFLTDIRATLALLSNPLNLLEYIGGRFFENFAYIFDTISTLKQSYMKLKKGYDYGRTMITRVFGAKVHKDFPKTKRTYGGLCQGTGFYPARLKNGNAEYEHDGIDLIIAEGEKIVTPFHGNVELSDNPNEVIIKNSADLPPGTDLIVTNIIPHASIQHPSDPWFEPKTVSSGHDIGNAGASACPGFNHIHVVMKNAEGVLDPSPYVDKKDLHLYYKQYCDDYKLVFRNQTIKAGSLVGLLGRKKTNTTKKIAPKTSAPTELDEADKPGKEIEQIKSNSSSMFGRLSSSSSSPTPTAAPATSSSNKTSSKNSTARATLSGLVNNISAFLKKFSIRKLKLGEIIGFLDLMGLNQTKLAMAEVMKTVKAAVSDRPCQPLDIKTDEDLRQELFRRGKEPIGTREDMLNALASSETKCPMLSLRLPTSRNLHCSFDDNCLGLECCLTIEVMNVLRSSFKGYVRFDPDNATLTFAFHTWKHVLDFSAYFNDEERVVKTGISFSFLEGNEMVIKFKINFEGALAMKVSFGGGVCNSDDTDDCIVFIYLLTDAVIPFPKKNTNGTWEYPKLDYAQMFDSMKDQANEFVTEIVDEAIDSAINQLLDMLGLGQNLLLSEPPIPRPADMTDTELATALVDLGQSSSGTRQELETRYMTVDATCTINGKTLTIPLVSSKPFLAEAFYYKISDNCMELDGNIHIPIPLTNITKSFKFYLHFDPCNYVITAGFEKWKVSLILFEYDWGKTEFVALTKTVGFEFSIGKNSDTKTFIVNLKVKVGTKEGQVFTDLNIPQPLCNDNFTIQGSIGTMAEALGGSINNMVFDLLLKNLQLDTVLKQGPCSLPSSPAVCPEAMNVTKLLPLSMTKYLSCSLADNCFGLQCCAVVSFPIPFSSLTFHLAVPFWFRFDPCKFSFNAGVGDFTHEEQLIQYDWGKRASLLIGKGNPAPVSIG